MSTKKQDNKNKKLPNNYVGKKRNFVITSKVPSQKYIFLTPVLVITVLFFFSFINKKETANRLFNTVRIHFLLSTTLELNGVLGSPPCSITPPSSKRRLCGR